MHPHFPLVLFPLLRRLPACESFPHTQLWTQSTLRPWGSSRFPLSLYCAVFLSAPLLLLLLLRPPPFLLIMISKSTPKLHTQTNQPTAAVIGQWLILILLPFAAPTLTCSYPLQGHVKIFPMEMLSVSQNYAFRLRSCCNRITKPIVFVFEKKDGQTLIRGLRKRFFWKLKAVVNLPLCEKSISRSALRKSFFFF